MKNKHAFTKEELTPVCLKAFAKACAGLPPEIAQRLTSNRVVRTHGSRSNLYLFNVWDENQTDLLHYNHFCYCFGYVTNARAKGLPDGYLHLWVNNIRLYQNREEIVEHIREGAKRACPKGFIYQTCERFTEVKTEFAMPDRLEDFPRCMEALYGKLIRAIHPVLMPIIDSFSVSLTREERRQVIAGRQRIPANAPRLPKEELRLFSRSIPPSWRPLLLQKYKGLCAECGILLASVSMHIDHVMPFSKGGQTVLENLRPLCPPCNLRKGNRVS
jgi:5-methylcytosine-specific restriction endonuclease McrA